VAGACLGCYTPDGFAGPFERTKSILIRVQRGSVRQSHVFVSARKGEVRM
jgi:hypothetical protein